MPKILCWFKHRWEFKGGDWVLPKQVAITMRHCSRCGLYQEIAQDHVNHLRFLDKSEYRPYREGRYALYEAPKAESHRD